MSIPFHIRPLDAGRADEIQAAFRIEAAASLQEIDWLAYPDLPRVWQSVDELAERSQQVLGAFDEQGALCGILVLGEEDGDMHIDRLAVDPQRQGEGWAGRLVNHALALWPRLIVGTAVANHAACAVYRRAGFVESRRWLTPDQLVLVEYVYDRADAEVACSAPLTLGDDGIVAEARYWPSPNCDARPDGVAAELLVVHNISLPPYRYGGDGVAELFQNRLDPDEHPYYAQIHTLRVSAHFFIRRDGELQQFVPVTQRAWHAGVSSWRGRERCNDFSVGVELEGCDYEPFTDAQYARLATLARLLRRSLALTDVTGHQHIAPGRKTDPGPFFDWARFRQAADWE